MSISLARPLNRLIQLLEIPMKPSALSSYGRNRSEWIGCLFPGTAWISSLFL